jgi:AraC family transcriptional regulator
MQAVIIERPATLIAGLRIRTLPMSPDISALWPRFVARIPEIAHQTTPRVAYGVMAPAGADRQALDYLAGVAVSNDGNLPDGVSSWTLPGRSYAVFRCPLDGLGAGYGEIFGRWLPESGFVQAAGPLFERYDEDFCPTRPESLVEIGVPVQLRPAH